MKKKLIMNWNEIPIIFDIAMAQNITEFSRAYIRTLARAGEFPARKIEGGHWRIDREQFKKWWESLESKQKM